MTATSATPQLPAAVTRSAPRQVWVGAINDPSGYTDELRGFLRALERCGCEPVLHERNWAVNADAGLALRDREMFDRQRRRQAAGDVVAIHQSVPHWSQAIFPMGVNVQRCMFETDSLPASWAGPLGDRDEVWVPSQFNVETFARGGIPEDRLKVLGGTLDFDLFDPQRAEPLDLGAPDGHFTFLTNFDFSERKGWRTLLRAWARAFSANDPVCLVLKTGSLFQAEHEVRARIEEFILDEFGDARALAPLRVMCDRLSTAQMASLYAGADAYVLASRGEGWGRPYMEALAMGLPTVASNWSGNLAFMEPETSWLVDGEVVPVDGHDLNADLYAGHGWFDPDLDEIVAALQQIASDPQAARAKAAPARDDLLCPLGPEATAARVMELAAGAFDSHGARRVQPIYAVVFADAGDPVADALYATGRNVVRRDHLGKLPEFRVPGIVSGPLPDPEPLTAGVNIVSVTADPPEPTPEWVELARRWADRVWTPSAGAREALVAAGVGPGLVDVVRSGAEAEAALARITAEGLPRARDLRRAEIEARSRFVVYAPDWDDSAAWTRALDAWTATFGDADDLTLALYVEGDADATGARIMKHLDARGGDDVPDLALVVPSSVSLVALAASAAAVLVDASADPASRPELLRRARRIVPVSEVAELR